MFLSEKEDGGEFSAADEEALKVLAEFTGIAIDHALRYTGTTQARDELARTVMALEAMTQVAQVVGGQTDLEIVLELIAKRGRALVSARALVVELKDGDDLVVSTVSGDLPASLVGRRLTLQNTLAASALRARATERLEPELNRVRFDQHGLGRFGVRADHGLVVPLIFQGRAYGVLLVLDRLDGSSRFSGDEIRILEAFASSAAVAVATAQSVATERRRHRVAVAEDERQRWARELHDETLQNLASLRIELSTAAGSQRPDVLAAAVGHAIDQLKAEIVNLRTLITDLRPAALDELGVAAALETLAERAERQGLLVDLVVDPSLGRAAGTPRPVSELETAIYRIVQEAVTNAIKHGGAGRIAIEVTDIGSAVRISVRDDGAGFDPDEVEAGFGLLGMRERAELLDGQLSVDSAPGNGTTVTATFPLERRAPEKSRAQAR
jgi:signal transduction histidine kinase